MVHADSIWNNILKFSEHFENNESKWCILSLFYTIFWNAEKKLKAKKLNCAFWRFLRPMLDEF